MVHLDVQAFPLVEADRPGLLPFPDVEHILRDAVRWWGVARAAALLVCLDTAAILEGRPDQKVWGAEKLAVRARLPADAVLEQAVRRGRLASEDVPAERSTLRAVAWAEPYRQVLGRFAV
jgi:hypothetical protein